MKIRLFLFLSMLVILFVDPSDLMENQEAQENIFEKEKLDVLYSTSVNITKGNSRIVNLEAAELSKDNSFIYLQSNYNKEELHDMRNKLKENSILLGPSAFDIIHSLSDQLHDREGNIKALFYNEQDSLSSILYADSARIVNRNNNMIAMGNVVIYSPINNLMLLGDKVEWNNTSKLIISESNNTFMKNNIDDNSICVQKSKYFESKMDLEDYYFEGVQGTMSEDCFND